MVSLPGTLLDTLSCQPSQGEPHAIPCPDLSHMTFSGSCMPPPILSVSRDSLEYRLETTILLEHSISQEHSWASPTGSGLAHTQQYCSNLLAARFQLLGQALGAGSGRGPRCALGQGGNHVSSCSAEAT